MDNLSRAFIEVLLCRSAWHAAQHAEGHVAHWLLVGAATLADLREARERTRQTRDALRNAQGIYRLEANNQANNHAHRRVRAGAVGVANAKASRKG